MADQTGTGAPVNGAGQPSIAEHSAEQTTKSEQTHETGESTKADHPSETQTSEEPRQPTDSTNGHHDLAASTPITSNSQTEPRNQAIMELDGVAFVTGAGSGVGKDIALTLAGRGATMIICADRDLKAVTKTVDAIPDTRVPLVAIEMDVTDEESVAAAFAKAIESSPTGRIDYFVNAAGSGPRALVPIIDMPLDSYDAMDRVHNIGSFLCLRQALRVMHAQEPKQTAYAAAPHRAAGREGHKASRGSIVMVTSLAAKGVTGGAAGYVASKHAVEGLIKTAAIECARSGIRVNGVAPTYINDTFMNFVFKAKPGYEAELLKDHPMGRLPDPEEVSDTVVFLLSAQASYFNGQNLAIEGGVINATRRQAYP